MHYLCPRVHICSLSSTKYATHTYTHKQQSFDTEKGSGQSQGSEGDHRDLPEGAKCNRCITLEHVGNLKLHEKAKHISPAAQRNNRQRGHKSHCKQCQAWP